MGLTLPQIQRTRAYQSLPVAKQQELIRVYHRSNGLDGNPRTLTTDDLDRFISTMHPDREGRSAAQTLRRELEAAAPAPARLQPPSGDRQTWKVRGNGTDLTSVLARWFALGEVVAASPREMVDTLVERAKPGSIGFLDITDHGSPGSQGVSNASLTVQFDAKTGENRIVVGGRDFEDQLARLRPLFASGATVDLGGCNVGATEKGKAFLSRLSQVLGVNVKAGDYFQRFTPGHEGRTIEASADGRVTVTGRRANAPIRFVDETLLGTPDYEHYREAGDKAAALASGQQGPNAAKAWLDAAGAYEPLYNPESATSATAHALVELVKLGDPSKLEGDDLVLYYRALNRLATSDVNAVDILADMWPKDVPGATRRRVFTDLANAYGQMNRPFGIPLAKAEAGGH